MIRREAHTAAGEAAWILISQVDHAHLSGRLAEHWGPRGVAPLVAREQLCWAIEHHDDGWRAWEQSPDVEPQSGRPRSFTEMELADSLAIWAALDRRRRGRRTAWRPTSWPVISAPCLRRFGNDWKNGSRAAEAERFLAEHDRLREQWLLAWQTAEPEQNTSDRAQLAFRQLQFFDFLSLWFCCAEVPERDQIETPSGPTIALVPQDSGSPGEPLRLALSPWPFDVDELNLEVPGRMIPQRRYQNRAELAAAPSQTRITRLAVAAGRLKMLTLPRNPNYTRWLQAPGHWLGCAATICPRNRDESSCARCLSSDAARRNSFGCCGCLALLALAAPTRAAEPQLAKAPPSAAGRIGPFRAWRRASR